MCRSSVGIEFSTDPDMENLIEAELVALPGSRCTHILPVAIVAIGVAIVIIGVEAGVPDSQHSHIPLVARSVCCCWNLTAISS